MPLLFPNLYQPIWGIEGIATWEESASTQKGRVPAGDFRLLIQRAAAAGRFEPLDRANGGNVDWPSGATPYLYGAYFHQYLAERYGAASLRTLADETSRAAAVPRVRARTEKCSAVLWESCGTPSRPPRRRRRPRTALPRTRRAPSDSRITASTCRGRGMRRDGRIFYSASSPHHFPALMELPAAGRPPRHVARRYLGNRIGLRRRRGS